MLKFTHPQYSVRFPVHRTRSERHYVAPHDESNWNGIGFVCSLDSKPQKDLNLTMASRRVALSGNASLIATFSSLSLSWVLFGEIKTNINTSTTTNYANVAYDLLPYNMESATLTIESSSKWRHCHLPEKFFLGSAFCLRLSTSAGAARRMGEDRSHGRYGSSGDRSFQRH